MNVVKFDVKEFILNVGFSNPARTTEMWSVPIYANDASNRPIAGIVGGCYKRLAKVERVWFSSEEIGADLMAQLILRFERELCLKNCELCVIDINERALHKFFADVGYKEIPSSRMLSRSNGIPLLVKSLNAK